MGNSARWIFKVAVVLWRVLSMGTLHSILATSPSNKKRDMNNRFAKLLMIRSTFIVEAAFSELIPASMTIKSPPLDERDDGTN